ncbi:uncharacterized protein VTP21DRAFT_3620 [Calcarisporiella thermophila]|uniref:uncharacterized protein n=1 Tax=Calcarisporiella thermophila TaxID=911321 RepID=UPI0037434B8E
MNASQPLRPLVIQSNSVEVSFLVSADLWVAAEQLRDEFRASQPPSAMKDTQSAEIEEQTTEMELAAQFLKFVIQRLSQESQFVAVARTIFFDFKQRFLRSNEVHAVTRDLPLESRVTIVQAYYAAFVALRNAGAIKPDELSGLKSALFDAASKGDASLFAVFGGQGNIEEYFDELRNIYSTYDGLVLPFLTKMSAVLREHAKSSEASVFHSKGLDVMRWLENPESLPDLSYLVSAPVSLPLIGLTQLLHYLVVFKILDMTPDQVRRSFLGATGHSQGIITAVAIAASGTEDEFFLNSEKALGLLFWIGTRSQQIFPPTTLNPAILQDSLSNNEGNPTPMLAIANLRLEQVQKHIEATNLHLPPERQIHISLYNGPRSFVCTAPPQSLYGLNLSLRKLKAPTGLEQSRVPFSQRKIRFTNRFLPITAPFHSRYLDGVTDLLAKDVERCGLNFAKADLAIPVFGTDTGRDLRESDNITMDLINQICALPVYWEKATVMPNLTHIVDFGPGGVSGIGGLTHRNKEGTGVQVILAGAFEGGNKELSYKADLFDTNLSSIRYSMNWAKEFRPKLVKLSCNGKIHVDTPMSRLLGKPPLMVAGMTPSTVNEQFVSAVLNAGYHVELAGGGHYSEKMLREKVDKIMKLTNPGEGITLNILYLNPRQWGFQYPLVQVMRREGYPMEGICIGAGVPSLDVANEIIENLRNAGLRHVAFKPGATEAIRQVVQIAAANPTMPIILQWTGGRAGGHHSFEDFHQPILETYAAIRRHPNIVLVAGSGFGGADDSLPYLTGDWSVRFDYPPMPFDGVLFGSRMMVAKEGLAALAVKEAIVAAPGIEDHEWEKTYQGAAGGIITVRSELGEPIHKLATRGVLLWKELDDTIFNLPKEKRGPALIAKRDYIIKRLNADFQKVWFGKKASGEPADLQDMTYGEVVRRMAELMYVKERWIDRSLRDLVGDFLRRVEERFSTVSKLSILQSYNQIDEPEPFISEFVKAYPLADEQLLTSEDVFHFLTLCQRRGQKPVPFIPVLDNDFEVWFKKDSLWQAEDLDSVVDQDVGRVCILQGPVAARHSTVANEPVADILGKIYENQIASLKSRYYADDESQIPAVEYLGGFKGDESTTKWNESSELVIETPDNEAVLPSIEEWIDSLCGPTANWLRALLTAQFILQGKRIADNSLRRVFRPRIGQTAIVKLHQNQIQSIRILDKRHWSASSKKEPTPCIEAKIVGRRIEVTLFEKCDSELIPFTLLFDYHPETGYAPIREVMEGRNDRIKQFYARLWFRGDEAIPDSVHGSIVCRGERVEPRSIAEFCQSVGNQAELYISRGQKIATAAPMDFAIVVGWKAIIKAIFPRTIDGDLLKLVHLSNGFRMIDGAEPLRQGDVVDTVAEINAVVNSESGKTVEVRGVLYREEKPVMEVTSRFFYRGQFSDFEHTFQKTNETPMKVTLNSSKDIAVLRSKEWFHWSNEQVELSPGSSLIFRLNSHVEFKNRAIFSKVRTTGVVCMQISTKEIVQVATVEYEAGESHGNPVMEYLRRHGVQIEQPVHFENGGYSVMPDMSIFSSAVHAPASNEPYARVSGDLNPIHVNPYFADLANLPGTITHGMWTSASTRKFVEIFAADNRPPRVTAYDVTFLDMVLPTDRLETKLSHVGMKNGKKIIKVETVNQHNVKVLEGTAEIDQPTTAYVFTGQGSQEQGMGMALYESSPVAKEIWDRADRHFLTNYGFSIIDIVRNNPKEKTIHFGGPKGKAIRHNYQSMTYDVVDESGEIRTLPLFPGITENTAFYTFNSPTGLLSATQFTQPALTLMEKAAFEDMRSKGLITQNCAFAGHSLGEYSALASIGDVLPIESLVDVVFYRGMTMQSAVKRDAQGRSNYGMCAVNPSRVSRSFNETALRWVIDAIARQSNGLLEIVNFNVENWQYVAAGELSNLDALANVLNFLKLQKIDLQKLLETMSLDQVRQQLSTIVENALEKANSKKDKDGFVTLERGFATIPLRGIDVPFHSSFLLRGVAPFRSYLAKKINPTDVNVNQLVGKYIPNLTAKPFSIAKSYVEGVFEQTSSPRLSRVLRHWSDEKYSTAAQQQRLGYILLVELLAYQFASPVRWIETQDQLFKEFGVERMIEIGPSPTLAGMAQRTLSLKYEAYDDALTNQRAMLCYSKDAKEIYYAVDPPVEEAPSAETAAPAAAAPQASAPAAAPVAAAPAAAPSGPAAPVSDEPVKASEVLFAIIAQKLKKSIDEIPPSKAIRDLVGGKSTLQNEILGDLQKEFANAPEKAEETPLDELAAQLSGTFTGSLGKHSSSLISRMVSAKMPGGFGLSNVRNYFSTTYGLGPQRTDSALLVGITMEPAQRLGSEADAKSWLDTVAQAYAKRAGISLSSGGSGGASGAGGAVAVINSEEFNQMRAKQDSLVRQQLAVLARYLGIDLREGHKRFEEAHKSNEKLQAELDSWVAEHGEEYAEGIRPVFSALKARRYDSYWNWVRQDALGLFYDIIFGRLTSVDREVTAQCIHVMNRANPEFLRYMKYHIDNCPEERGDTYHLAKSLAKTLFENCQEVLNVAPVYKDVTFPTGPKTTVTERGDIVYKEVHRPNCRKLAHYVKDMAAGSKVTEYPNREKVAHNLAQMYKIMKSQNRMKKSNKLAIRSLYGEVIRALSISSSVLKEKSRRQRRVSTSFSAEHIKRTTKEPKNETIPFLHLKRRDPQDPSSWRFNSKLTNVYLDVMMNMAQNGCTFESKNVLLTGCGNGSIGAEVLKGLLSGGARVVVTTSRFSREATEYYQSIYQRHGSKDSCLIVVPFNQGSKQDVEALVDYIYNPDPRRGLGWDLDFVIPFAAISENGREIDSIDSRSELAHRILLTNLLRLLGAIKARKQASGFDTRPAQVILPLSPNHGTFGNDGLYGESKIALETLFNRWYSESWASYLVIAGAVIGWTRGTGLMSANNIVAEGLERLGVRTFSTQEMAFNILGLMHPTIVDLCQSEPVWADLNGGFQFIPKVNEYLKSLRQELQETSEIRRAIVKETALDEQAVRGAEAERRHRPQNITPRANMRFPFPGLKKFRELNHLSHLRGMLDLEKVVVITGFGEVGPWGNSRTRWEIEAKGEFSLEGCIELAWIMGLIRHHHGPLKNGTQYSGWVDALTGEPVQDLDIKSRYEKQILDHTGIRLIEPELFDGYNPEKKGLMQEVVIDHDLEPFECSKEEAMQFKLQHGDKVDVWEASEGDQWVARFKKGAALFVPKALRFDRLVAGQVPTGWDALRYGVPKEIVEQVDKITLYVLVSTVEALVASGITDPYEFYQYVHISEVGNTAGSGIGGMQSLRKMYKDRFLDKPVQKDILQETFINTMPAWVNMLLLSSAGPIKTPVGACATAAESIEIGTETILSGKAKIVIVGGYDDFQEEGSYEFANMKATSNALEEMERGRTPREMSRPATSTRSGFMESQGAGIEILMQAKLAIEMGVPIYGIVALTNTATDKEGRSIPAPGQGILTTAREVPGLVNSPLLDIKYRARQLRQRRQQIKQWVEAEYSFIREELEALKAADQLEVPEDEWLRERTAHLEHEARRQEKEALNTWGNEFWRRDPRIAPIRGALASFGLTVDDIGVCSFHGTSTKANDKNESDVVNKQFAHLGRTPGNACPSIFQKWLTGHPKGAAASWQINGVLQVLQSGIIPGNRNADNIDEVMRKFEYILYPSRSIQTDGVKAGLIKSLGFGQACGEVLIIHPDYVLGALEEADYEAYCQKNSRRQARAYRFLHDSLTGVAPLVQVKNSPPYPEDLESSVYLSSTARATYDPAKKTWAFTRDSLRPQPIGTNAGATMTRQVLENLAKDQVPAAAEGIRRGVGVDVQLIAEVNTENQTFLERNFTESELAYARSRPDPRSSLCGLWSAKESVVKCLSQLSEGNPEAQKVWNTKGAASPLRCIEITHGENGAPQVILNDDAQRVSDAVGLKDGVRVSISHSGNYAVSLAIAEISQ